jgi:phenylalanyl-tRNA synthetase beta chain
MHAQVLATRLMTEVCGATVAPGTIDIGGPGPDPATIRLREARVRGLLGIAIPRARQAEILTALDFTCADAPDGLDVIVPALRRGDVTREADVIEEVSRIGALAELPATLPPRHGASGRLTAAQRARRAAADLLCAQGLTEIVGWSFEGPDLAERLRIADRPVVSLRNPMSAEQSRLRTTLLGSLLGALQHNRARGAEALGLFESGPVYVPGAGGSVAEPRHLAALSLGAVRPASWRAAAPPKADFYTAKGALGGLLDGLGVTWSVRPLDGTPPFLHPGRSAEVVLGAGGDARAVGWLGELHPSVTAHWDLDEPVAGFELDLDAATAYVAPVVYRDLTSFPEVREDLAVIVPDAVAAADVLAVVREAGGRLLADAEVFDVYRDAERVGEGHVSLALRLRFRAADRTLTDEEVSGRRRRIAKALSAQLQGRVRDS